MALPYENVPSAVDELTADNEVDSEKARLARNLMSQGLKPLCVGRSIVTIERLEDSDEREVVANWGSLSISVYPDPDVVGHAHPTPSSSRVPAPASRRSTSAYLDTAARSPTNHDQRSHRARFSNSGAAAIVRLVALRKKGRRKLTVDGQRYYWLVGKRQVGAEKRAGVSDLSLPLVVVRADAPGRLTATFSGEFIRAFLWEDDRHSLTIQPDLVARVIRAALASGWKPDLPGQAVLQEPNRLIT